MFHRTGIRPATNMPPLPNDTFCTFYLVRHGQTDMNVSGLLQSQSNSILTEKGKEQALQLATELKTVKFDAIFSSDLTRAKDTADIIAAQHNLATQTTELLRERAWGKLEEEHRDVLKQFDEVYQALNDEEKFSYKSYPDIENDDEVTGRFITFIREVAVNYSGKNILLVSHGSAIGSFLIKIGFWSYKNVLPSIPHTSYIKFVSDGVNFFVEETKGFDGIIPRELKASDR